MTDKKRQRCKAEWKPSEGEIEPLPVNRAERARLERRQDEIEYLLGPEQVRQRREKP